MPFVVGTGSASCGAPASQLMPISAAHTLAMMSHMRGSVAREIGGGSDSCSSSSASRSSESSDLTVDEGAVFARDCDTINGARVRSAGSASTA